MDFDDLYARLRTKKTQVAVDSRNVKPGDAFFALKGAKTDGHHFLEEVRKKGALFAVVKDDFQGESFGLELIRVKDPLVSLQEAAKKFISESKAKIIAVTGSLGKTTTKGFIYQILKSKYKAYTTSGNKNSQIGLALAILNETEGDEDFLVLEMAMTQAHQIERLTEIAPPHMALITSIALVHAENFESIEDIARAKAEVFCRPKTELVIINKDTACSDFLLKQANAKKKTYSMNDQSANRMLVLEDNKFFVIEEGKKHELGVKELPAAHVYQNLLGAISVARECGLSFAEIAQALPALTLPERRLQEVHKKGIVFINDSYNAAENSIRGALDAVIKRNHQGRKIAVLGNMPELGKFSEECHKRVGEHALLAVEKLYCFGAPCKPAVDVWKEAKRDVEWFLKFEELFEKLKADLQEGDLVLVKGARMLALERVVELF